MAPPPQNDFQELMNIVRGFRPAKVLMVATELGLFDALEGPRSAAEAAAKINADPRALEILLNALTAM